MSWTPAKLVLLQALRVCINCNLAMSLQGFSADWWKTKHNTHHAAPNELDHDCKAALDPDIDTLPLIAWSVEMLETLPNASHRMLVRAQHYFFFPILLFARLSWCQQSVAHAYTMSKVCHFINNAADIDYHLHLLYACQV